MEPGTGKKCRGTVTGITGFGAFVRLEDGRNGLIHISKVSDRYVKDVHDFLTVGQEVEPTVLAVDEKGRISLSLVSENGTRSGSQTAPCSFGREPMGFESMMSHFKSVSEDKIADLNRSQNSKKGRVLHRK